MWSRSGSNRRPRHCERRALPTELRPHFMLVQSHLKNGLKVNAASRATEVPIDSGNEKVFVARQQLHGQRLRYVPHLSRGSITLALL